MVHTIYVHFRYKMVMIDRGGIQIQPHGPSDDIAADVRSRPMKWAITVNLNR
jgi:hypothetical protein